MKPSAQRKPILRFVLLVAAVLLLIGALSLLCLPLFRRISDPAVQEQLARWIESLGFGGWLLMLGIQMLQIVVAFIPGEPVELLMGVLYGTWGGLFTCLLGIAIASAAVFFTVRRFGRPLVERIFGKEKLDEFRFFNDVKKMEAVTFLLFLLPGTPKDMLTYIAGISRIKPAQFLLIATFARIPSVITSAMMGASVSRGNWTVAVVTFLATAVLGLFGILYKNKFMARLHRSKKG